MKVDIEVMELEILIMDLAFLIDKTTRLAEFNYRFGHLTHAIGIPIDKTTRLADRQSRREFQHGTFRTA